VHHRTVSVVKRGEFVSDRMSYIVLRGSWSYIIVFNVHALSKEKIDDSYIVFMSFTAGFRSFSYVTYENSVMRH